MIAVLVAVLATLVLLALIAVTAAKLRLLTVRLGPAPKPKDKP